MANRKSAFASFVIEIIKHISANSKQKLAENFDEILNAKSKLGNVWWRNVIQNIIDNSLKYFVKSISIIKLLSVVPLLQTTMLLSIDGLKTACIPIV